MKYMTVIDVKEAFQNIPLTLRSSLMTTMFTPWGRYRWTRLPFGISSASEEWQRRIHMVLEGLQVISIADDILIPECGETNAEARIDHDRNIITVLEQFEQHHVKLNVSKMKFLVRKAVFMGHVITTDGLQPNPATVILQVDALDYGQGTALLQPSKQHSSSTPEEFYLQPVAYSSKSLTPMERRYAQIGVSCHSVTEGVSCHC